MAAAGVDPRRPPFPLLFLSISGKAAVLLQGKIPAVVDMKREMPEIYASLVTERGGGALMEDAAPVRRLPSIEGHDGRQVEDRSRRREEDGAGAEQGPGAALLRIAEECRRAEREGSAENDASADEDACSAEGACSAEDASAEDVSAVEQGTEVGDEAVPHEMGETPQVAEEE